MDGREMVRCVSSECPQRSLELLFSGIESSTDPTAVDLISSAALGGAEDLTVAEVVAYAALGDGLQQQPQQQQQQQQQPAAQLSTSQRLVNSCRRSHV